MDAPCHLVGIRSRCRVVFQLVDDVSWRSGSALLNPASPDDRLVQAMQTFRGPAFFASSASRGCGGQPRAFSAVELLVVIGVIGLLMALLIPSIRKSLRHAASTVCQHNLHELHQALHAYRLDNRGWLPDVQEADLGQDVDPHTAAWFGRLAGRYIPDRSVLLCPSDPARTHMQPEIPLHRHPNPGQASSYGMNDLIRAASRQNLDRSGPRRPMETILLADMGPDRTVTPYAAPITTLRTAGRLPWDDRYHPGLAGLTASWLTERHFGHINILTIGGTVRLVRTRELMQESITDYYGAGAAGGCPLCLEFRSAHYSFARSDAFWWTGSLVRADAQ